MKIRRNKKMLFKIALTLILGLAIATYFLMKYSHIDEVDKETVILAGSEDPPVVTKDNSMIHFMEKEHMKIPVDKNVVHLAVVVCGERFAETMVLLKSAVVLTKKKLYFHIIAEDELHDKFETALKHWPADVKARLHFTVYPLSFPKQNTDEWKRLFKRCASQRLFLPSMLHDVDTVLYVDTDTLFVTSLDDFWNHLEAFNSTQIASMTVETENAATGWYNRFALHPYYGETGMNSGVMLMNLTRMRQVGWEQRMQQFYSQYKFKIVYGDQDLINIYFSQYPDQIYATSCEWNYRPDQCMYINDCKSKDNIRVIHGSRRCFHNEKQPAFKAVYDAFKYYELGSEVTTNLIDAIKTNLLDTQETNCGKVSHLFYKNLEDHIARIRSDATNHFEEIEQNRTVR